MKTQDELAELVAFAKDTIGIKMIPVAKEIGMGTSSSLSNFRTGAQALAHKWHRPLLTALTERSQKMILVGDSKIELTKVVDECNLSRALLSRQLGANHRRLGDELRRMPTKRWKRGPELQKLIREHGLALREMIG